MPNFSWRKRLDATRCLVESLSLRDRLNQPSVGVRIFRSLVNTFNYHVMIIKVTAWGKGVDFLVGLGFSFYGSYGCPANEFYFMMSKEDTLAAVSLWMEKYKRAFI